MKAPVLGVTSFLFATLCCSGCGVPSAGSQNSMARDQVLIIVDLSTSLTDDQRRTIPGLLAGFVLKEGKNADVTVYPLVSDIGNSETLAPQIQPPKTGRIVDIVDWQNYVKGKWAQAVKGRIEGVLGLPKKAQDHIYTSCYIASAVFADRYFSEISNGGRLRLLWVGDLIEDCPLPEFRQYRLPNPGSIDKVGGLNLGLKKLGAVNVIGAIIPHDPAAGPSDASFIATTNYWDALEPHLGLMQGLVHIGPANAVLPPAIQIRAVASVD